MQTGRQPQPVAQNYQALQTQGYSVGGPSGFPQTQQPSFSMLQQTSISGPPQPYTSQQFSQHLPPTTQQQFPLAEQLHHQQYNQTQNLQQTSNLVPPLIGTHPASAFSPAVPSVGQLTQASANIGLTPTRNGLFYKKKIFFKL